MCDVGCPRLVAGPVHSRRQPEMTALFQVMQQHLLTFEQQWTDEASGRTLPRCTGTCRVESWGEVSPAFSVKPTTNTMLWHFRARPERRAPSCLGRRMNEGALNLVDYVLPEVALYRRSGQLASTRSP